MKNKLSYSQFRLAVREAYSRPMSSPCVFFSRETGFYAHPSARLIPNNDILIGEANFSADTGKPWIPETRKYFSRVKTALIELETNPTESATIAGNNGFCAGSLPSGEPCGEYCYDSEPCHVCGTKNTIKTVVYKKKFDEIFSDCD